MMNKDEKRTHYKQIYEASALGLMFPLSIGLGFGLGYWLDKIFGTWPWLTGIFSVFGIAGGFLNLFRFAARNDTDPGSSDKPPRS